MSARVPLHPDGRPRYPARGARRSREPVQLPRAREHFVQGDVQPRHVSHFEREAAGGVRRWLEVLPGGWAGQQAGSQLRVGQADAALAGSGGEAGEPVPRVEQHRALDRDGLGGVQQTVRDGLRRHALLPAHGGVPAGDLERGDGSAAAARRVRLGHPVQPFPASEAPPPAVLLRLVPRRRVAHGLHRRLYRNAVRPGLPCDAYRENRYFPILDLPGRVRFGQEGVRRGPLGRCRNPVVQARALIFFVCVPECDHAVRPVLQTDRYTRGG